MQLNNQKHIAFVIYSLESGGAERVVSTLANYFIKVYKVTIITIINKPSFYELDSKINIEYCVNDIANRKNVISAFNNNIKLIRKIKEHLKKHHVDLTLSFMTTSNVLSVIASKALKIPCIISERSNPYIYTHNSFWNKLIKYTYPKANRLVVQSKLIKDYYIQFVDKTKVSILPNPISETLTSRKVIPKESKKIILNVGRLDSNKAQDLLIKAFANIERKNWNLTFVGDGHLRNAYQDLTEELNINQSVTFAGNVNDIENYYNKASIFAFTSKSEGFPNALVEAMYFELACVSTDCPTGPSEVIEDSNNGFLIPVDDQKALEYKLEQLMTNENLRKSYGKEAYKTAQACEITNVAAQWNKLITELL